MDKFYAAIRDRMNGGATCPTTRYYPTWESAQKAGEKLLARKYGRRFDCRYFVDVILSEK